jgi:hypothetical protein
MIGMAMPLLREMVSVGMFRACSTRARRHDEEVISGLDLAPAGTSGRREDSNLAVAGSSPARPTGRKPLVIKVISFVYQSCFDCSGSPSRVRNVDKGTWGAR